MGKETNISKALYLCGNHGRICGGYKCEGWCALPDDIHRTRQFRKVVYVDAPESLVCRRWAQNRDKPTRRDVSESDFEEIISAMEPPNDDEKALVFRHYDNIKDWLATHEEFPRPLQGSADTE